MSDFEKELRRRKREQEIEILRAIQQKGADDQALRMRIQSEKEEKEKRLRQLYDRYVAPVRPEIDQMMDDVAKATWKRDYGHYFSFNEYGAHWLVGRNQWYDFKRKIGPKLHWRPIPTDKPTSHALSQGDRSFQKSETFEISLTMDQLRTYDGTLQQETRERLMQTYLRGPSIGYPVYKPDMRG